MFWTTLLGFKHFLLAEAQTFLQPNQTLLNTVVKAVNYSDTGVTVLLDNGRVLTADHALVTFSVGVLQHDDVLFHPPLPSWKLEAIESMKMATYTKIFLVFDHKFWHDTQVGSIVWLYKYEYSLTARLQMGLYAHPHQREYLE